MIAEYCNLLDQGYTTAQIAKKFGLCIQTVYNNLEKISEESGRPIEELRPGRKTPKKKEPKKESKKAPEKTQEDKTSQQPNNESVTWKLKEDFDAIEVRLDNICAEIQKINDAEKTMPASLTVDSIGGKDNEE